MAETGGRSAAAAEVKQNAERQNGRRRTQAGRQAAKRRQAGSRRRWCTQNGERT